MTDVLNVTEPVIDAEDNGLSKEDKETLKAAVSIIKRELQKEMPKTVGESRTLSVFKFGTFKIRVRKGREAISPATKQKIQVPPKTVVGFKPSTTWMKDINGIVAV